LARYARVIILSWLLLVIGWNRRLIWRIWLLVLSWLGYFSNLYEKEKTSLESVVEKVQNSKGRQRVLRFRKKEEG
jgi:hypothetical protein